MTLTPYGSKSIFGAQEWAVEFCDEFDPEFDELDQEVQDELIAQLKVLEKQGPLARRPRVDTLNGSDYANTPI